jgi:hypothetical protein
MVEIKNLLFQPITLHYGGDGRGFHMGPREKTQIRDDQVSPEMEMAAKRGQITLTRLPGEKTESPEVTLPAEQSPKENISVRGGRAQKRRIQ